MSRRAGIFVLSVVSCAMITTACSKGAESGPGSDPAPAFDSPMAVVEALEQAGFKIQEKGDPYEGSKGYELVTATVDGEEVLIAVETTEAAKRKGAEHYATFTPPPRSESDGNPSFLLRGTNWNIHLGFDEAFANRVKDALGGELYSGDF